MGFPGWAAFAALGFIWGIPYYLIKIAVQEFPPVEIAFSRVILAAAILLPLAWQRGALVGLQRYWLPLVAFAVAEFAIPFVAISFGEQRISSSITGILIATVPLTTALLQRSFGISESLSATRLGGLVLGFLGVAVLLGSGTFRGADDWTGVGCLLLAALGYALGPLIVERYLSGVDSLGAISASLLAASCMLIIPASLQPPVRGLHMAPFLAVVGLGMLCTAVAMLLMFYLVRRAGASRAVVITYINPVVATLLGIFLLNEHLGWSSGVAFALILTGSWAATRGRKSA